MHESLSIPYKPFPLKKTVTAINDCLGCRKSQVRVLPPSPYEGVVQLDRTPLYRKNPVLKKVAKRLNVAWVAPSGLR